MPYQHPDFISPLVCLQYQGKNICHTYRDDELEGGELTYSFTASKDDREVDWQFDVRELPAWKADPFPLIPREYKTPETFFEDEAKRIRVIITKAIEAGEIRFP